MTHVTRDQIIHVTRARVTAISRFPVTCVTSGIAKGPDELTSGYNAVTREAVRRAAQAFRRLLRERDNRPACQSAARTTKLLTVTAATLPGNPRCFPWDGSSEALRGIAVQRQRLESLSAANSLCCGHIGRGFRARTASTPFTLVETARSPANWPACRTVWPIDRVLFPNRRGEGEKMVSVWYSSWHPPFAVRFRKFWPRLPHSGRALLQRLRTAERIFRR